MKKYTNKNGQQWIESLNIIYPLKQEPPVGGSTEVEQINKEIEARAAETERRLFVGNSFDTWQAKRSD